MTARLTLAAFLRASAGCPGRKGSLMTQIDDQSGGPASQRAEEDLPVRIARELLERAKAERKPGGDGRADGRGQQAGAAGGA